MEFHSIETVAGTSTYQPALIPVGRLADKAATQLTFQVAKLEGDGGEYKDNTLCKLLVAVGGGVPLWHRNIGLQLRDRPALDTM